MRYFYDFEFERKKELFNATFLGKVERNALNPLAGLTFVSIAYYQLASGEIVGKVF